MSKSKSFSIESIMADRFVSGSIGSPESTRSSDDSESPARPTLPINPIMFGLSPFWPHLQHHPFMHHKLAQQWPQSTSSMVSAHQQYAKSQASISSDEDTIKTEPDSQCVSIAQSTTSERSSSSKWMKKSKNSSYEIYVFDPCRKIESDQIGHCPSPMLRHVTNYIQHC